MILLEARNKAKAGTEDHHDAAGKAGVPHVGDLVQFQVKPPGVRGGDSVARVSWRHVPRVGTSIQRHGQSVNHLESSHAADVASDRDPKQKCDTKIDSWILRIFHIFQNF